MMESFDSIFQRAAERKGGVDAIEALLPVAADPADLLKIPDDRYLAEMTRCVFRSGFVWKIIESKWANFETAFDGFDVSGNAMMSDEKLEALSTDAAIVRNGMKIRSVRRNAAFILEVREQCGSFGRYLADWPEEKIVGLWDELKVRGDRLGGQTGRFFLRFVGKATPVLSADVVAALIGQGVIDKPPASKKSLAAVQQAFNRWAQESGRDLSQISRVLAMSV
jgi:3-methyladenine DNA glycosylase Tag